MTCQHAINGLQTGVVVMSDNLQELINGYNYYKSTLTRYEGQVELLTRDAEQLSAQLARDVEYSILLDKANIFLQRVSSRAREVAKTQIETSVTNALQFVFGPEYSFKITTKNGVNAEADFFVVTNRRGKQIESAPSMGKGGGIIDILAVSLKFALLELLKYDGLIWLDEPFKHVSEDYIGKAGRLLQFMAETSGRQIILITHNEQLAKMCARTVIVTQENGRSSTR